jgi:hypothetical protein
MEKVRFNYSLKNIPIPPRNSYIKSLLDKTEKVIKTMRWKALFYDNPTSTSNNNNSDKFGFRSRKCPPVIADMKHFENDVFSMVNSIEFRKISDPFQQQLQQDIKIIIILQVPRVNTLTFQNSYYCRSPRTFQCLF